MTSKTSGVKEFLDELNQSYVTIHTKKEDAFWTSYMGLDEDPARARKALDEAEIELKGFLGEPERLRRLRDELQRAQQSTGEDHGDENRQALEGWIRTFEAHSIDSVEAKALAEELIEDEGRLARARGEMSLGYQDPDDGFVKASSVKLGVMLGTEDRAPLRRAAWEGLRSIEDVVLDQGFVELVAKRNRFGRELGGEDYYDAIVRRVEGMSKKTVFSWLDELERATRDAAKRSIDSLRGSGELHAADVRYRIHGDVTQQKDPYFPFSKAFERWGRCFAAMNVDFREAQLVLDLVDREGKYENGFMHGAELAWRDAGTFRPARIQFTANAIPGMVGSGRRAAETLFHEGGHAAHFANTDMPAPCFAQEFAPTSVSFAETQSMFFDAFLGDADWQLRYARTKDGDAMPLELVEKEIETSQPFAAWGIRAMMCVCYAERAIYEIPENELSKERILEVMREQERKLLFLEDGAPRPSLSIPHLLAGESSASYHGYVLALMAVQQTRQFFAKRDGFLLDNPRIGPDMRDIYWRPGNSQDFSSFIERMTGEALSAKALAAKVNRTVEEALSEARAKVEASRQREAPTLSDVDLGARIRIVHGNETIASTEDGSFLDCARTFEAWIEQQESKA